MVSVGGAFVTNQSGFRFQALAVVKTVHVCLCECLVSVTAVHVVEAYLNVCLSWLRGG